MASTGQYVQGGLTGAAGGAAAGSAFGPWGAAIGGIGGGLLGLFGAHEAGDAADKYKAAMDAASGQLGANTQSLLATIGKDKAAALGYYAPLQKMFTQAYGTGGIQGPQVPQGPGKPMSSMFGGGNGSR